MRKLHVWLFYLASIVATPAPILWYQSHAQKKPVVVEAGINLFPAAHWEKRASARRQLIAQNQRAVKPLSDYALRRSIANVGEIYKPIRQEYGEIPSIQKPLQQAKRALARKDYVVAKLAIRQSWVALKAHAPNAADPTPMSWMTPSRS